MKIIFIIFFYFFYILSLNADDQKNQLEKLFNELKITNISASNEIEQKIWDIWSTHPTNPKLTSILSEGSNLMSIQEFNKALDIFTKVIELDPSWAEAWNKRATVLYLLGDYEGSQKDIDKVLKLEKRHFGALAGQGLVNIQLKNFEKAIKSYQKVLEIYPSMRSSEIMIKEIEALIKQELI